MVDLERLFRRYYGPLCRFFSHRGVTPDRSPDFVQETFLRAARSVETFRGDADIEQWLFAIALNLWRNELRGRSAAKRDGEEVPLPAPHEETASFADDAAVDAVELMLEKERQRRLSEGMERLPAKMRQVLSLRIIQGWNYRQISELLGISEGTVKSQMFEARKRLQHYVVESREMSEEVIVR